MVHPKNNYNLFSMAFQKKKKTKYLESAQQLTNFKICAELVWPTKPGPMFGRLD